MLDWNTPISVWWSIAFAISHTAAHLTGVWWGFRRGERRIQARHDQCMNDQQLSHFDRGLLAWLHTHPVDADAPHDPAEFARVVDELRTHYLRRREAPGWRSEQTNEQTIRRGRDRHVP